MRELMASKYKNDISTHPARGCVCVASTRDHGQGARRIWDFCYHERKSICLKARMPDILNDPRCDLISRQSHQN